LTLDAGILPIRWQPSVTDLCTRVNEEHEKRPSNIAWNTRIEQRFIPAVKAAQGMARIRMFLSHYIGRQLFIFDGSHGHSIEPL
jgi:hypothetical protein